ncbi:UNVERIFIED_CONTAM: hypothetical protein K2H54_042812 [Gekko kuhli]
MSGTGGDDGGTIPVTTAKVLVTMATPPVMMGLTRGLTPAPRPRPDSAFGIPTFYTPAGLSQQRARLLQPRVVPNPFMMGNPGLVMATGALTQWGHFNPGSTMETYLLTKGLRCESPWDPQMQCGYQTSGYLTNPGGSVEGSMAGWYKEAPEGRSGTPAEIEVPMEEATGGADDEDELWIRQLAAIKMNQFTIPSIPEWACANCYDTNVPVTNDVSYGL